MLKSVISFVGGNHQDHENQGADDQYRVGNRTGKSPEKHVPSIKEND